MKQITLTLGLSLLLTAMTFPAFSQVSNDNEDEVYKIDQRFAHDFVPGQVLVKMKDSSPAKIRRIQGKFKSAGISQLDAVLQEFGVEEMEQLLPNEKPNRKMRKARAYNGDVIQERDLSQLYLLQMNEEKAFETERLVDRLNELLEVEYAEPNYKVYIMSEPAEGEAICTTYDQNPLFSQQWGLTYEGLLELWSKPIVNPQRPVIAILDTGVDITHPDLVDNIWTNTAEAEGEAGYDNDNNGFAGDVHGWDFVNNTPNVRDNNMHGTHVAGIAAAANNGIGIIGANPQALIMPITVMQSDGTGDVATLVRGIDYAVVNGATVLNMSLGTYANSRVMRQALERAYSTAVIVAAAGNDSESIEDFQMFPAAFSFVIGVQATTFDDQKPLNDEEGELAPFSNYDPDGPNYSSMSTYQDPEGFNYEMKAPGERILSTIPNGKYKLMSGTSMAAPLVAGAISALKMVKEYDSQEILWGDLLHTETILEAFNNFNRPAELDLLRIQMRDRKELTEETEEDYSGDGEIDAGETLDIYPVIRTTYGEASNIKMHLEMGDEFEDPTVIDILSGEVDFGSHLDAYGKGVSVNPLRLRVASNVADNRHIKVKVVAHCDESTETFNWPFTIVVSNMVKISGLISEDRTLTADHIYLVKDNIGIMEGATLTIEPGTCLEFERNTGISSSGKLVADGTPEKPIIFKGHNGAIWNGISTHESLGWNKHSEERLYTNEDQTLFTLLPTEVTPIKAQNIYREKYIYYGDVRPRDFYLSQYFSDELFYGIILDMTNRTELLTDINFLSPSVLKMLSDWEAYCNQYSTEYSEDTPNWGSIRAGLYLDWGIADNPRDKISYCRFEDCIFNRNNDPTIPGPIMNDCVLSFSNVIWYPYNRYIAAYSTEVDRSVSARNTITGVNTDYFNSFYGYKRFPFTNFINNFWGETASGLLYSYLNNSNYFNNASKYSGSGQFNNKEYWLVNKTSTISIDKSDYPSYLGTSREDIVRPYIFEIGNAPDTYGQIDLSNMRTTPIAEAHGVVWKVCVNGKDAQDEYEDLAPLGVGKHKFEIYFNRPMNKEVAPQISFGVRDPYTQNAVAEDGSWNEEGTIYTAFKTITGKTKSDGVNRIYVQGAEDNEFFPCPFEKSRFNINIQVAGSMATGFIAEAGLGKVCLTWNNDENNFDDAMGFNIYRYTLDGEGKPTASVRINEEIVDIETIAYTDYDVTPGTTYYYMYKVLSTDLQEYDVSNVVAVTPLTGEQGDANGSGEVDVADVITTVNYAAGQQPKPFIFEAADMNTDLSIDILDVIGIIKKIMNPGASTQAMVEATATYTIEDGTLYVESPVELAGVQVQIAMNNGQLTMDNDGIRVADDLNGFEHTSAWLSDDDYLFLAYNMNGKTLSPGKHALLHIGNGKIGAIRFSDVNGHNVEAIGNEATRVNRLATDIMTVKGIYDLQGRKLTGDSEQEGRLPKGVYIINGRKVVR